MVKGVRITSTGVIVSACPKCGGSIRTGADVWGEYVSCLSCGYAGGVMYKPPGQRFEECPGTGAKVRPNRSQHRPIPHGLCEHCGKAVELNRHGKLSSHVRAVRKGANRRNT